MIWKHLFPTYGFIPSTATKLELGLVVQTTALAGGERYNQTKSQLQFLLLALFV